MSLEVRIHADPFTGVTGIAFFKEENGKTYLAKPMEFILEEIEPSNVIIPTLQLSKCLANQFMQELSNGLNKAGFRSEDIAGYANELKATNRHLEDMQKLVFNYEIQKP